MSFLSQIAKEKEAEVAALLDRGLPKALGAPPVRSLAAALRAPGLSAIAEIKRRSPSQGELRAAADPAAIALDSQAKGAAAISVLTDGPHFGGSIEDLRAVRSAVDLPVLRKDFLLHPAQLHESRAAGADAVLLIVAMLEAPLFRLLFYAAEGLGMEVLVEVHDKEELALALECGATIIGVNNRNLATLEVDLAVAEQLIPTIPTDRVRVAESGIQEADDSQRMARAGADAVLVGTRLMKAPSPGDALQALLCG